MLCYNKVNILEQCNEIFICSVCCDPRMMGQCKIFSTSSASLFIEHQRCFHLSLTEVECIYCCCYVSCSKLVQHIQSHFLFDNEPNIACLICQRSLKSQWHSAIDHMQSHHNNESPQCPHCHSHFYSLNELKNHLVSSQLTLNHCLFNNCLVKTHSKDAILAHLSRKHSGSRCFRIHSQYSCAQQLVINSSCNCQTIPNSLPDSHNKPHPPISNEYQLIDLPYSTRVLAKLSTGLDERLQEDVCAKMEQYSKFKVQLDVVDGQKQFVCSTCQYRSVHSLADVRKHILGCHCSVSTSYTRLCLRASRLDTNNFTLFSDRKLIFFANEKLKRVDKGTNWEGKCDFNGLQLLDDSEQESGSNSESMVRSVKRHSFANDHGTSIKKARVKQRQSHVTKMRSDSPVPEVGPPLERKENFDRIIHLNYSWPVLELLVNGQCPERYLSILKQKMDVYSQHRILLTRRNGKRYFLCSHCPNCSPHGMNDIRKHILGVHARLPERFKSAAMYCSRMNRDNYSLLSDDELLKKNQDMVRWRSNPGQGQDDFGMEPLAPLQCSSSPEDDNNNIINHVINNHGDALSHNIFLSGVHSNTNNDECSPSSDPITSFQSMFATILANNVHPTTFSTTIDNCTHELSDEESCVVSSVTNCEPATNGRSRRSLVLKCKAATITTTTTTTSTTNHNSTE